MDTNKDLDILTQTLKEAGLGHDVNWLAIILFVRNLLKPLSIYSPAQKEHFERLTYDAMIPDNINEEGFRQHLLELESFLKDNVHTRELKQTLSRERLSTNSLITEMNTLFSSMRTSHQKQETTFHTFGQATEQSVKTAKTRKELLGQMRGLITEVVNEFREEARQWEERAKSLERSAQYDALLAELFNRRSMDIQLSESVITYQNRGDDLSFVMIDLDFFKNINDTHGHSVGDDVLRTLAKLVKNTAIENNCFAARFGGDEIALICPLSLGRAAAIAEVLRRDVEEYDFLYRPRCEDGTHQILHFTVSIGVAELQKGWDARDLIEAADKALYLAKESGRNLVGTFDEDGKTSRVSWV